MDALATRVHFILALNTIDGLHLSYKDAPHRNVNLSHTTRSETNRCVLSQAPTELSSLLSNDPDLSSCKATTNTDSSHDTTMEARAPDLLCTTTSPIAPKHSTKMFSTQEIQKVLLPCCTLMIPAALSVPTERRYGSKLISRLLPKKPRIKVCVLSTGGSNLPVLQDVSLVMKGLASIQSLDPENIMIRTSKMIDVALDKFFDCDISEGALLILIISSHGYLVGDHVFLPFITQDGATVSSMMLEEKIKALPEHCTLEVIVDTCYAEGVVPGLRRVPTTDSPLLCATPIIPVTAHTALIALGDRQNTGAPVSCPTSNLTPSATFPCNALPKYTPPLFEPAQPKYKAKIVTWAASETLGSAYTEENLPERKGINSIMIGAIFNYLISNGSKVTRREGWKNVLNIITEHNNARQKRDSLKSPKKQASLNKNNRIQRPVLLTSVEDPAQVLNGCMFQPI